MKDKIILAIETSCDETAIAIVKNSKDILANVVYSQIDIHKKYGGVVPEIASRRHVKKINNVYLKAMNESGIKKEDIDEIAVTYGPGLVGALLVGISFAKGLAYSLNIPIKGVNHLHGHIFANYTKSDIDFPFISLIVSGGNTVIVKVLDFNEFKVLGRTRDDAAGEAFDKIARVLGLGYPGGPIIDKIAKDGNCDKYDFPRSKFDDNPYDFSFSGLKTSVLNFINIKKQKKESFEIKDVCASFQKALVDVLVDKTTLACKNEKISTLCLAGGVGANSYLRDRFDKRCTENDIKFLKPKLKYCTDNAVMIAIRAFHMGDKKYSNLELNANPNLKIEESE